MSPQLSELEFTLNFLSIKTDLDLTGNNTNLTSHTDVSKGHMICPHSAPHPAATAQSWERVGVTVSELYFKNWEWRIPSSTISLSGGGLLASSCLFVALLFAAGDPSPNLAQTGKCSITELHPVLA